MISRTQSTCHDLVIEEHYDPDQPNNFKYLCETHWSSEGACSIRDGIIRWTSGGVNSGYSSLEVARVMSTAFALASERLYEMGINS